MCVNNHPYIYIHIGTSYTIKKQLAINLLLPELIAKNLLETHSCQESNHAVDIEVLQLVRCHLAQTRDTDHARCSPRTCVGHTQTVSAHGSTGGLLTIVQYKLWMDDTSVLDGRVDGWIINVSASQLVQAIGDTSSRECECT